MTDTTIKPWGSIELAVKAFVLANFTPVIDAVTAGATADEMVGGDYSFDGDSAQGLYVHIFKVDGVSDRISGYFTVDLEVFGHDFLTTESHANQLDALVLGYPHVVEADDSKWVFDRVTQTAGPQELPWEDDAVTRMGATYVITARRR